MMPETFDLQRTLKAVLGGQKDAFLAVVRVYGPSLRTFLGTQLFHLDELDDMAQEVFIAAYHSLPNFKRTEDFGAWLRGIARHKLLNYYQRTARRRQTLELFRKDASVIVESDLEEAAARTTETHLQVLLGCINKLPDRMRKVVRGWLDGEKAAALVDELKLSLANIYQIQHRASQALRECLKKELAHAE